MDTGTILALAGLGLTVITLVLPYTRFKPPTWAIYAGLIVGLICLAVAALEIWNQMGVRLGKPSSEWATAFVYVAVVGVLILASQRYGVYFLQHSQPVAQPQDPTPSGRSAEQILDFVSAIKKLANPIPIKIVSIEEWMPFSKMLAKAIQVAGFVVQENTATASFVFPAVTRHNKTVVRYRGNSTFGLGIWVSMMTLSSPCDYEEFPDTDVYNFIQLEIGGSP